MVNSTVLATQQNNSISYTDCGFDIYKREEEWLLDWNQVTTTLHDITKHTNRNTNSYTLQKLQVDVRTHGFFSHISHLHNNVIVSCVMVTRTAVVKSFCLVFYRNHTICMHHVCNILLFSFYMHTIDACTCIRVK